MDIAKELSFKDFEKMSALELKFYGEDYVTPAEEAYLWYQKYPHTVTAAKEGDSIAGFVNLFPVKDDVFEKLKAGKFNDSQMKLDDIADINGTDGKLNMFLCCIVIDEKYRRGSFTKKLLLTAAQQYESVYEKCGDIVTDNVTKDGSQFSDRYGFSFVCNSNHGSKIYIQKFADFLNRIKE